MTTMNQAKIDTIEGINEYMDRIRVLLDAYYDNLNAPSVAFNMGKKYCRIVLVDENNSSSSNNLRIHSFVDLTNGNILYAASWKAPAKHPRGNVFDLANSNFNVYGADSLR